MTEGGGEEGGARAARVKRVGRTKALAVNGV